MIRVNTWILICRPREMEGWVGLVGWPIADSLPTKWSPVHRTQGSESLLARDRQLNHWATLPTLRDNNNNNNNNNNDTIIRRPWRRFIGRCYSAFIHHEGRTVKTWKRADGQTDNYNKIYVTDNLKYSKIAECLSLADVAKPYFSHSFISLECLIT